jgi:hypothetical protein
MKMDRRLSLPAALVAVLAATSAEAPSAAADPGTAPASTATPSTDTASCDAWQVEYALNAIVVISDTTMGAGDGSYPNGPGHMTLRFENHDGQPGGKVQLLDYQMKDSFTVVSKALAWKTSVKADTVSKVTPDACGVAAAGEFDGKAVRWNGAVSGMRSDGSLLCDGTFCGKFGAPPEGRSELHVAPHPVTFKELAFAPDMKTFTMGYSIVSQQQSPSQTSRIGLAGREVRRTCVAVRSCP